ncbi:MAG: IS1595 family transposase, partial [Brevundimonas sp.]|nr:IS1595 family transposase [Brevundimonas sp.]
LATYLMASSKKGISAHQIGRTLGVTYKTAWFMCHRIREAMTENAPAPLGGPDRTVEADETYIGGKERNKHRSKRTGFNGTIGKEAVVALVERNGRARSFHVANVNAKTIRPLLMTSVHRSSTLMTDKAGYYIAPGKEFASHGSVDHARGEYSREGKTHSNTAENFFSILKRGIIGTFHHVSEAHLKRYLAEFDFRYSNRIGLGINDTMRTDEALRGIGGKRLTYRRTAQAAYA